MASSTYDLMMYESDHQYHLEDVHGVSVLSLSSDPADVLQYAIDVAMKDGSREGEVYVVSGTYTFEWSYARSLCFPPCGLFLSGATMSPSLAFVGGLIALWQM